MSTTSTEKAYEHTFHSDDTSKYWLPNDAAERHRLRVQHDAIVAFMHNKPIHAPVTNATKIFDLGCGVNASMTLLLAQKFPCAQIYGVDLSAISVENVPSNVEFIQGNVHNLIGKDPRLEAGSADYIYSRFMAAGVEDWSQHIKSIARLLKPGGYVELHESIRANWRDMNNNDEEVSKDWEWLNLCHPGMSWPERDPTGLEYFQSRLKEAGLESVEGTVYKLTSSEKSEAKLWSEFEKTLWPTGWEAAIEKLLPGKENLERRKELQRELFETLKPEEGKYFPCVVVWGRKV